MLKRYLVLLFIPFLAEARSDWNDYLEQKKAIVSHERHLPFLLTHNRKTEKSVLLVHGIYSSPLYFKGMAEAYFQAGFNVVTVILPGHWEKDFQSLNKVKNADWSREVDKGYEIAKSLGHKVILSGHSLGGLLSIEQALKRPSQEIHSLVLISPALKVWSAVLLACRTGVAFNLSGNQFEFSKPDGVDIPYFAPIAGPLIQSLSDRVLVKPIHTPVFVAFTWNDNVVDVGFVNEYFKTIPAKKKLVTYGIFSGISHGDISQAPTDEATHGNQTNSSFNSMMDHALEFISSLK